MTLSLICEKDLWDLDVSEVRKSSVQVGKQFLVIWESDWELKQELIKERVNQFIGDIPDA